jgi:hypothetical protein
MIEFLLGCAAGALISISITLWVVAERFLVMQGTLSSVSHALIALAKERNK